MDKELGNIQSKESSMVDRLEQQTSRPEDTLPRSNFEYTCRCIKNYLIPRLLLQGKEGLADAFRRYTEGETTAIIRFKEEELHQKKEKIKNSYADWNKDTEDL